MLEYVSIPKEELMGVLSEIPEISPELIKEIEQKLIARLNQNYKKFYAEKNTVSKKIWNIVPGVTFKQANQIHPMQQRDVQSIITLSEEDSNIKKIIIFGSSLSKLCNPWSDLDIYLELKTPANMSKLQLNVETPLDIWTNFTVDTNLLNEIEMGVKVYG